LKSGVYYDSAVAETFDIIADRQGRRQKIYRGANEKNKIEK